MVKKMKKVSVLIFALLFLFGITSTISANTIKDNQINKENNEIQPRIWPGRPGGNGDGSEEWLKGCYGQTNGPYKLFSSGSGRVSDLNKKANNASNVGIFIAGTAGGIVSGPFGIFISGLSVATGYFSENYQGNYYIMKSYYSGRSMKIDIITYENPNFTKHVKTYTVYKKW